MIIRRLKADGLRESVDFTGLSGRVDAPSGPAGLALADALDLFAAALEPDRVAPTLARLGVAAIDEVEVLSEQGAPVQASWPSSEGVDALLAETQSLSIEVEITLDPVLFGMLREQAVRDARLATALADATLHLRIGWLFTNDRCTAAPSLNALRVGSTAFPLTGTDRPRWASDLARAVAGRVHRLTWDDDARAVAVRLHDASLSADPAVRAGFSRARAALAQVPFGLGSLELVRGPTGLEPRFGDELRPARAYGPSAAEALRLVEAVFVVRPDVLVVEAPGIAQVSTQEIAEWLVSATEGNEATLEQVVLVPGGAI